MVLVAVHYLDARTHHFTFDDWSGAMDHFKRRLRHILATLRRVEVHDDDLIIIVWDSDWRERSMGE